jgi:hypothetical protein
MKGRDFVWVLFLNDMRSAHSEDLQPVARAATREELEAFVERERALSVYTEPTGLPPTSPETELSDYEYRVNSQRWHKTFRAGGPLEWFNPPSLHENHFRRLARIVDYSDEIDAIPVAS